ncbi:MAG TPA: DUF5989 family protein [Candidatus Binatia bacterium]|nr:DUF5989 family protein [Candidatus Binatia bacterium]
MGYNPGYNQPTAAIPARKPLWYNRGVDGESDMGLFRTTGQRLGTAGQLFSFFWGNKRWWLTPILITLALFAVVLILAQSSAIAPFIYTFF